MSEWVPAEIAPRAWEGKRVWHWASWDTNVKVIVCPIDYSRAAKHCDGVWLKKFPIPRPPVTSAPHDLP